MVNPLASVPDSRCLWNKIFIRWQCPYFTPTACLIVFPLKNDNLFLVSFRNRLKMICSLTCLQHQALRNLVA